MKKAILFKIRALVCCLFFSSMAIAQTQVNGYVYSNNFGQTLPGITVTIEGTNIGTITNSAGFFSISALNPGTYTLMFSGLGYSTQKQTIQITNTPYRLSVTLTEGALNLSEVTILSTRTDLVQSTLISQIDKQIRPVNNAQDLFTLIPGLFIAQHAGGGKAEQLFFRGFDQDHGTDFAISIDGLPVNMVSHAHGQGYSDFHFVIPETVEDLSVYKGPYSAKFGDFATAGAGAFTTKNKLDKTQIKLEAGDFNTYRGLALIDLIGNSDNQSAYLAGEYVYTDAYFESPQKFNRFNVFGKYNGYISPNSILTFSASAFGADWFASGQIPQREVDNGNISRFGAIDDTEGGNTSRYNANLILSNSLGNGALLKNQVFYSRYNFELFSNFTFFLDDAVEGDGIFQKDNRNIWGYNGSYEQNINLGNTPLTMLYGASARIDNADIILQQQTERTLRNPIVGGEVMQSNLSLFTEQTLKITPKFAINTGLRLDYFNFDFQENTDITLSGKDNRTRLSPKLNFLYSPTQNLHIFAKTGIGFHSNDARSVVLAGFGDESLPRAYGYEIGSTFKIGNNAIFNVAAFGLDLESELVYVGDAGVVEASGRTNRIGLDISSRIQITSKLFTDLDVNLVRARAKDEAKGEDFIPLAPQFTSVGGITYKQDRGFSGALRYRFIADRPANEDNSATALGHFILDAVLDYRFKNIKLGLSAENLFNIDWNQAQFDTQSRLFNEANAVNELHFTPGSPFFIKANLGLFF